MSDSNGEKSRIGPNPEIPPQPKPAAGFSPPPDGGLLAWTNVLGSFILYFNTWGILNTSWAY